jgi:light-regulated signal transduction histidine kinase (bacteriophytochrome)
LEASNNELEAFSYSVSHDLRSPLRAIDGFAKVILERYADKLDDGGQSYFNRMRAASQRMAAMIDAMLELSRVTRSELRRENVDLSKIAHGLASDFSRREPERDVTFVIKDGIVVNGDPVLLRQVMDNVLQNAWKFTSKRSSAHIEFGELSTDEGSVCFVRDNGAGFDMAFMDNLFGAFQRLHKMTEFPGTGVGLATVSRIIRRHGGRIWAEGEEDKGATFCFSLPN